MKVLEMTKPKVERHLKRCINEKSALSLVNTLHRSGNYILATDSHRALYMNYEGVDNLSIQVSDDSKHYSRVLQVLDRYLDNERIHVNIHKPAVKSILNMVKYAESQGYAHIKINRVSEEKDEKGQIIFELVKPDMFNVVDAGGTIEDSDIKIKISTINLSYTSAGNVGNTAHYINTTYLKHVLEFLKDIDLMYFTMVLDTHPNRPIVFTGEGAVDEMHDTAFRYIVMPVRAPEGRMIF